MNCICSFVLVAWHREESVGIFRELFAILGNKIFGTISKLWLEFCRNFDGFAYKHSRDVRSRLNGLLAEHGLVLSSTLDIASSFELNLTIAPLPSNMSGHDQLCWESGPKVHQDVSIRGHRVNRAD